MNEGNVKGRVPMHQMGTGSNHRETAGRDTLESTCTRKLFQTLGKCEEKWEGVTSLLLTKECYPFKKMGSLSSKDSQAEGKV